MFFSPKHKYDPNLSLPTNSLNSEVTLPKMAMLLKNVHINNSWPGKGASVATSIGVGKLSSGVPMTMKGGGLRNI